MFSIVGEYLKYRGGVFSTVGDIMSIVGDIMVHMEGYHEYRRGCSVPWGYHDTCGGYHEYRGGLQYRGGTQITRLYPPLY